MYNYNCEWIKCWNQNETGKLKEKRAFWQSNSNQKTVNMSLIIRVKRQKQLPRLFSSVVLYNIPVKVISQIYHGPNPGTPYPRA